jgi:hypothetical protein
VKEGATGYARGAPPAPPIFLIDFFYK